MLRNRCVVLVLLVFLSAACSKKGFEGFKSSVIPQEAPPPTCENLTKKDPWGNTYPIYLSCSTPTKVPVLASHPAEIDLTKYERVAFTNIGGNYGEAFSAAFKEQMVKNGKIKIMDRAQLDKIKEEMGLTDSDLFDASKRAKLGKLLPATALVIGQVNKDDYQEATTESSECSPGVNLTKKKICSKTVRTGIAHIQGEISIAEVESGALIQVKRLSSTAEKKTESTSGTPGLINKNGLYEQSLNSIVDDMVRAILPWEENLTAIFYADSDLPVLARGILEAQSGGLQETKSIFIKAVESNRDNEKVSQVALAKAYFNLGAIHAYLGEYQKADENLSKAEDLAPGKLEAARMRQMVKCLVKEEEERKRQAEAI